MPSFTNLAANTGFTAVENAIPDVSSLVKITDYDTEFNETKKEINDHSHDKYITTPGFNKVTAETFEARLAQANLVKKTDFGNKLKNLNKKTNSNKTKHLIAANEFQN